MKTRSTRICGEKSSFLRQSSGFVVACLFGVCCFGLIFKDIWKNPTLLLGNHKL